MNILRQMLLRNAPLILDGLKFRSCSCGFLRVNARFPRRSGATAGITTNHGLDDSTRKWVMGMRWRLSVLGARHQSCQIDTACQDAHACHAFLMARLQLRSLMARKRRVFRLSGGHGSDAAHVVHRGGAPNENRASRHFLAKTLGRVLAHCRVRVEHLGVKSRQHARESQRHYCSPWSPTSVSACCRSGWCDCRVLQASGSFVLSLSRRGICQ